MPTPSSSALSAPSALPAALPAPWWQQAWLLVLAGGIVMGLALGVRHVQGLFLLPVTLDRGWSRETFGFAMAIQNLSWGIAQPFAGMVADRFGSAKVIAGGLLFYAVDLGFLAFGFQLAFITTHLPAYLLDKGMAPADAVTALAIIALANVLGSYSSDAGQGAEVFKRACVSAEFYAFSGKAAGNHSSPVTQWLRASQCLDRSFVRRGGAAHAGGAG